jgi:phage I-like protein
MIGWCWQNNDRTLPIFNQLGWVYRLQPSRSPNAMTELLQQVIAALQKLPDDQQDAIASRLLAELNDEQQWAEQFKSTTDDQWDHLAAMVRQEIATDDTIPLDEVFPVKP